MRDRATIPGNVVRGITCDRGFEFTARRALHKGMGTKAWFCHPQASWHKGSVGNMNKPLRRYLLRDMALLSLANRYVKSTRNRLNATPRKALGHRTPAGVFREELMQLRRK